MRPPSGVSSGIRVLTMRALDVICASAMYTSCPLAVLQSFVIRRELCHENEAARAKRHVISCRSRTQQISAASSINKMYACKGLHVKFSNVLCMAALAETVHILG